MCKGMNSTDLFDPDWTKPHSYQVDFYQFSLPPSPKFPFCLSVFHTCPLCSQCNKDSSEYCLDKAPRLSISIVIWILSSDTICQLNQFHTNSEAVMLSTGIPPALSHSCFISFTLISSLCFKASLVIMFTMLVSIHFC